MLNASGPKPYAWHMDGANGQPVFWRYYDPRVLSLTLAIFDTVQRQALLGPIKTWQFAWAGHRWQVPGPGVSSDTLDGYVPAWPRPEQWPGLVRGGRDATRPKPL